MIDPTDFDVATLEAITLGTDGAAGTDGFLTEIKVKAKLPDGSAIIGKLQDKGVNLATKGDDLANIYYQDPADNDNWTQVKGTDAYAEADAMNLTTDLTDITGVAFGAARPDVGPIAYPAN